MAQTALDPSMGMRLETYLLQLSEIQLRWIDCLSHMQRAAQLQDLGNLEKLQSTVELLRVEMQEQIDRRGEMISEGQQAGLRVASLRGLAERLPAWSRPRFRAAFMAVKNQADQLRRMHIATWVLLHQTQQHLQDVSLIFTQGSARRDVYECGTTTSAETGGHLLNTSL